ncbi:MAG: hypothetical protein JRF59_08790 [Deltaproteobacteria bacterium]|nr:hypothetical protein [Deltaproteobacteria bacterium]MBW1950245.1 hypothetical protein [Deltaproteobacteria bacterium]MBW2008715.1 hypothetical protein [Deltaproteobacteria bacterium]MBW2347925.1 hypothetical protein [Deltaproteobacteria bacterium]
MDFKGRGHGREGQGKGTDAFLRLLGRGDPVVLLEGTRNLPEGDREALVRLAQKLAARYPRARFRTGNAAGTDEAFARGVAKVDPGRLEFVLPYRTLGKARIPRESTVFSLEDIQGEEWDEVCRQTREASPGIASLVDFYLKVGPRSRAVKAAYLLRDALKVVGARSLGLDPASIGFFYVDAEKPLSGGTGHTVRLCRQNRVPVVDQGSWMGWA